MAANMPFVGSPKSQRWKLILFVTHKLYWIKGSKDAGRATWVHSGRDACRGRRLRAKCPKLGDNSGTALEVGANRASGRVRQGGRFLGDWWWSRGATAVSHAVHGGHRAPGLPKGQGRGRETQRMGRLPQRHGMPGRERHSRLPGEADTFPSPGSLYSNLRCERGLTGPEKKRYWRKRHRAANCCRVSATNPTAIQKLAQMKTTSASCNVSPDVSCIWDVTPLWAKLQHGISTTTLK